MNFECLTKSDIYGRKVCGPDNLDPCQPEALCGPDYGVDCMPECHPAENGF